MHDDVPAPAQAGHAAQVDDRRGGAMNWSQLARHTATAIGIAFVIAAGIYFAIRFSLFALREAEP